MDWMEIFTLVTGIIYLVLEIRQKNFMWVLGVVNAAAAMYMFWKGSLYASFVVNAYYFLVSFWGFYQWRKDAAGLHASCDNVSSDAVSGDDVIHLNRITLKTVAVSAVIMAVLSAALILLLDRLDDPMSALDAPVAVLGAIATFWLSRSYKEQWLLWIVANLFSTVLCLTQGLYWMSLLYIVYTLSSIYGYSHWRRNGIYLK
ncbi:MAG: nicotinamide riboside transporter PnuC [Bacteroidales bacterium]|nr:nicotinamide riboside transporter PnuC [Bacteroidales bacterium]